MSDTATHTVVPAAGASAPRAPKSRRLLVFGVAGLVVVASLGGGAWFLLPRFSGAAKTTPAEPVVKATVPLGAVVVNLGGETRRYLRVGVSLGVPASSDGKQIADHHTQLMDLLIAVLSAADPQSLTSTEGKEAIKRALLSRIRDELRLTKVGRIYFTEFVIQ
jgi:flagellar FliL protein